MNTPKNCNTHCTHCRTTRICNADHNAFNTQSCNEGLCALCICKDFPFFKTNNNEFLFMMKDTFREVIKTFKNFQLDQNEDFDMPETCTYRELEEIKNEAKKLDSNTTFSMLHVNIRSLTLNIDKLRTILYGMDSNPDIIAVTESRINDDNSDRVEENSGDAELNGYRFFYDESPTGGRAGGAGLFIKNGLYYVI